MLNMYEAPKCSIETAVIKRNNICKSSVVERAYGKRGSMTFFLGGWSHSKTDRGHSSRIRISQTKSSSLIIRSFSQKPKFLSKSSNIKPKWLKFQTKQAKKLMKPTIMILNLSVIVKCEVEGEQR